MHDMESRRLVCEISQSGLLLENWKSTPLTVSDLASLNVELAEFAYLSTYHTLAMRDFRFLDEVTSLLSAIQLPGYLSVVGDACHVADNIKPMFQEMYVCRSRVQIRCLSSELLGGVSIMLDQQEACEMADASI